MHNTLTCLLLQSLSFPLAVPKWLVNSNEADNEPCKMTASRSLEFPSRRAALQDKISFHLTKKFVFKYVSLRCLGNPVDNMTDCFNFWILTQEAPTGKGCSLSSGEREGVALLDCQCSHNTGVRRKTLTSPLLSLKVFQYHILHILLQYWVN